MKRTVFLAVLLLAFAIPTRLAANGTHDAECNPTNRAVIPSDTGTGGPETGATSASGHAKAFVAEIEGDFSGILKDLGGAWVELEFEAEIEGPNTVADPGDASGVLEVEFHWTDPKKTGGVEETELHSGCVEELETIQQPAFVNGTDVDNVGEFEGEFEGQVHDFPFYRHSSKAAVGSVSIVADADNPGRVEADVSIELGSGCKEDGLGNPNVELEKVALKNLDPDLFHIKNVGAHGVWNFPIGISTANDNCNRVTP